MTNFDLYKLLNFVVNKDVYAQALDETEFDLELKAKNIRHFRKRLGLPEKYQPGQAKEGDGATRVVETDLSPFFIEGDIAVLGGVALLPNSYYISDFYTTTSITSDIISRQEIGERLNNKILKPTYQHLAAYVVKEGLRVYPINTAIVHVLYYRKPIDPVFKTTTNPATLELEYNAVASTELEWDEGNKLDILNMILMDMGVNIERGDVQQYANKLIETGK